MHGVVRMAVRLLSVLVLTAVFFASDWVGAQDGGTATPTPLPGLGSLFGKTPVPADNTPEATGTPVVFESFQITLPPGWLAWTLDRQATELDNERALIALVSQVDAALAADAEDAIRELIPPLIIAGVAPETPGNTLIYITVLEYGYQASLSDMQLPATASPAQFIEALGFPQAEQRDALTAGFLLDDSSDEFTYYGGFVSTDLDRLVLVAAVCDPASWQTFEPVLTDVVASFALSEQPAQPAVSAPTAPPSPSQGVAPGTYDMAELPYLTPINILVQQPYRFPFAVITTGALDLTTLDIDPTLEKIEGTDYYPPLTGFVSADPVFAFYAVPNANVSVVFAGNYYVDTVLLVRRPDGHWHFADDVRYANPDPALATNAALEGVYEVWIGAKLPGQQVSGELFVIVE